METNVSRRVIVTIVTVAAVVVADAAARVVVRKRGSAAERHSSMPYARGGPSPVNNLRLLCAKHNNYTAATTYGEAHMEKYRKRK